MSAESNIASPIVRGGTSEDITWPFVLQSVGGKLYIHHVKLSLHDTGTVALQKLRRKYILVKSEQPYRLLDKFPVFWKPVIQTAVLSPNSSLDLEAQKSSHRVFVKHRRSDVELTAAFHCPDILSCATDFVKHNERFSMRACSGTLGKRVLLITLEMNWVGLIALVIMNLFLCLGTGIVAGEVTKRVDLGVAVTSGAAGVLACIQAVLFLVYK